MSKLVIVFLSAVVVAVQMADVPQNLPQHRGRLVRYADPNPRPQGFGGMGAGGMGAGGMGGFPGAFQPGGFQAGFPGGFQGGFQGFQGYQNGFPQGAPVGPYGGGAQFGPPGQGGFHHHH